jgi:dCTP deaminase
MSVLTDNDIFNAIINLKTIKMQPFTQDNLQPASYELTLSPVFRMFDPTIEVLDPMSDETYTKEITINDGYLVLHPGEFVLGSSIEYIGLPSNMVGLVNGKSSLGRLGLQIHATAGFFDPGFRGTATFEMSNVSRLPLRLYPGMLIAQMVFMQMTRASERPYGSIGLGSHYQNQEGPTESRYARS